MKPLSFNVPSILLLLALLCVGCSVGISEADARSKYDEIERARDKAGGKAEDDRR